MRARKKFDELIYFSKFEFKVAIRHNNNHNFLFHIRMFPFNIKIANNSVKIRKIMVDLIDHVDLHIIKYYREVNVYISSSAIRRPIHILDPNPNGKKAKGCAVDVEGHPLLSSFSHRSGMNELASGNTESLEFKIHDCIEILVFNRTHNLCFNIL